MKATRRIVTLALAMLIVFALSVTAFAVEDLPSGKGGTIVVEGAELQDATKYTVYTVYKMFDVLDGNNEGENTYKASGKWLDFATMYANPEAQNEGREAYFELQPVKPENPEDAASAYMIWLKNTNSASDAAVIAQLAREYVQANPDIASVGSVTVNNANGLVVESDGYYLLVPSNTTASGVIVVKDGKPKVITEKSVAPGMPTLEKKVIEDSTGDAVDINSVDIGQTINYRVTVVAGVGASNYIIHDIMDDHVVLYTDSFSVTRGGNPVAQKTAENPDGEYTVVTDDICEECTFHIVFEEDWCNSLQDKAKIVVNYNGVLLYGDDNHKVETDLAHENEAWLTHTHKNIETDHDTVGTMTYEINVKKIDQEGEPLANAGFKLRDNEHRFYKFDEEKKTVSWVADEKDGTEYFSDDEGKLTFYGVDAEVLYLKETTVPGGYTGIEETLADVRNGSLKGAKTIEIENTLGTKLPETGGIGTTVFYIGGVVLVLSALAAMVVIKRKEV